MTNITKASQNALKPCPFCGSSAAQYPDGDMEGHSIMCSGDRLEIGASCPMTAFGYATEAEAAERWNLRAALQDKAGEVRDARFWLEAIVDIWSDGDKAPEHRCYVEGAFSDAMREASALLDAQPSPVVPELSSIAQRKLSSLQADGWVVNGYAIRRGDERGFVDASGFVGWWRSEHGPVVPDDHPLMIFAKECRLGAYMEHEVPLAARKAIAAAQQKGSAG